MLSMILGSIFVLVAFFAYASDIIFLGELIPFALLLLPVYLYCRKRKLLNVYFAVGIVFAGARFYMNMLLADKHPDKILLPITIDQPIIKQFTGMTVIIALFIWYTYILYASLISIKDRCDKVATYEELMSDSQIIHFANLFKLTTLIVFCEILSFVWIYDLTSVVNRMIVFMLILVFMAICFFILMNKAELDKKIALNKEIKDFVVDVKEQVKTTEVEDDDFEIEYLDKEEEDRDSEE